MNPQERQLVTDLFDRLSQLESAPRDRDAVDAIQQGLRNAPNAIYPLVQTVLLQEEALKRASARIEELEARQGGEEPQQGGFLDSMRGALFGGGQPARGGSVPSVRPGDGSRPQWNDMRDQRGGTGFNVPPPGPGAGAPPPPAAGGGGSFLGTAAAAAAGVIGGSMLMNSIGGLMGGNKQGFGDQSAMGKGEDKSSNPWSGGDQGKDNLSREAGLNDVGSNRNSDGGGDDRQGFSDHASYDEGEDDGYYDDDFDDGDSDFA